MKNEFQFALFKMKIQYASDLYLEFAENNEYMRKHPLKPSGDILVLAGDIGLLGRKSYTRNKFWDWVADNFQKAYIVPGNHEFYGGYDLEKMTDGTVISIRSNVEMHYNSVVPIDGNTDLIITTLWAWISNTYKWKIQRSLCDFYRIKYRRKWLTVETFNEMHAKCLTFLQKALNASGKHFVVATHHLPTFALVREKYHDNPLVEAFSSELTKLIEDTPAISHWIYGHSHYNHPKVKIGKTSILTNQLGYVEYEDTSTFNPKAVFRLEP